MRGDAMTSDTLIYTVWGDSRKKKFIEHFRKNYISHHRRVRNSVARARFFNAVQSDILFCYSVYLQRI